MQIGYWLASEEHAPPDLVESAVRAERAGFDHLLISDHIHPWVNAQGHSPFVWGVIGAIAQATERITLGTAVTCPLIRMHPAIVAHAASTARALMPGRFFLAVGTGERLNEHVLGDRWPRPDERLAMLDEAVEIIRRLFRGEYETFRGTHYTVEQLKLYDAPDDPAPIVIAAKAPEAIELAAAKGDGTMNTGPDADMVKAYRAAGGTGPIYGKVTGCLAPSREEALRIALERQPNPAMPGALGVELSLPRDYESVAELVRPEDLEDSLALGDDLDAWREKISAFDDAGFTHVALHDVAEDQAAFVEFAKQLL